MDTTAMLRVELPSSSMGAEQKLLLLLAESEYARREAVVAAEVREQLLSVAAHELRGPLTVLAGYASLLQQKLAHAAVDGQAHRMAASILEQTQRLEPRLKLLLDVSHMQQELFEIAAQPVDVGAVVELVVEECRLTHSADRIDLTRSDEPLLVLGDALRLEQVVQNLLTNALKYGGSTIYVRLARQENDAVLEVADQGIGIPAMAQPHLFRPFYRASNIDPETDGCGIGLYVVSKIVRRHDGRVGQQSRRQRLNISSLAATVCEGWLSAVPFYITLPRNRSLPAGPVDADPRASYTLIELQHLGEREWEGHGGWPALLIPVIFAAGAPIGSVS